MFGLIEYFFIILNLDPKFPNIMNVLVRSHVSSCLWMVVLLKTYMNLIIVNSYMVE